MVPSSYAHTPWCSTKSQKDIYADLWNFSSAQLPPFSNFAAQLPAASASLNLISVPSTQPGSTWDPLSVSLVQNVPPGRKLGQHFFCLRLRVEYMTFWSTSTIIFTLWYSVLTSFERLVCLGWSSLEKIHLVGARRFSVLFWVGNKAWQLILPGAFVP